MEFSNLGSGLSGLFGSPTRTSHTTKGGFGGIGKSLDAGGYKYYGFTPGMEAPSGMTETQLMASFTPEQLGQMDFSKADAGQFGTDASGFQLPEGLASNLSGYVSTGSKVLEGIGALMNAQNAKKSMKLANEKFGFEKAAANRNVINQSKAYNEELGRRADVGLALGGNAISPEQRQATLDKIAGQRLSETAIG